MKQGIMNDIVWSVMVEGNGDYRGWRIGVTNNLIRQHAEWGQPVRFRSWQADSLQDARDIESYFVRFKGMKRSGAGEMDQGRDAYVYIF